MNVDRLHTLAKFLRRVPAKLPGKFDLDYWVHDDNDVVLKPNSIVEPGVVRATCGMTACAVGWAASIPKFQEDGFSISVNDSGVARPSFQGLVDWSAVSKFFDLSRSEAHHFFMPDNYPEDEETSACTATANDVADRIDDATGKSSKGGDTRVLL